MHALHFFYPFEASLGRSVLFYLVLASAALLGIGWKGGSSTHKFYPPSGAAGFCPGILSFTRWVVRLLEYFLLLYSNTFPIRTPWWLALSCTLSFLWVPIWFWGVSLLLFRLSNVFRGGSKVVWELDAWFRAAWSWGSVLVLLVVFLLSLGYLVHLATIGWRSSFEITLVLWLPSDTKDSKFLEVIIHDCGLCPWGLLPYLLVPLSLN